MEPADVDAAGEAAESAFASLVRAHADAVFGFVRRRVRDRDLAEDLVQETFLRAWRARDSYRGDASPRGWLYAIAGNVVRDWGRRRQRRPVEVEAEGRAEPVSVASDPAGEFEAVEAVGRLRGALDALPATHREMFLLRERDGLSYREIAEALACPVGTVMSGLARARERLLAAVEA